uniref:Uncharacterized protein n=1 Tax=Anguilla anguilla TaxID=7936 RepID=A0A0E9WKV9_ANGAN
MKKCTLHERPSYPDVHVINTQRSLNTNAFTQTTPVPIRLQQTRTQTFM